MATVDNINYTLNGSTASATGYSGSALGSLVIPDTITFNSIIYTVISIGNSAFANQFGFDGSLTIGNNVTSIGNSAFQGCSGFIGSLTIGNNVISIDTNAFQYCSGFTDSLTIGINVTSIGDFAFDSCSGFTGSLIIPDSVTSIGESAFNECYGFTDSLTISNAILSINIGVFSGCNGFTSSLTIPNLVTSIGSNAFYNCYGFTGSLTIPNSVTCIGANAFYDCSGFFGTLAIPNSIISIDNEAFGGLFKIQDVIVENQSACIVATNIFSTPIYLSAIVFNSTNSFDDLTLNWSTIANTFDKQFYITSKTDTVFYYNDNTTDITSDITLNNTLYINTTEKYLISVIIGTNVSTLSFECFFNNMHLIKVIFNTISNISSLGGSCFQDCTSLTSITIPNNITSYPNNFLYNCGLISFIIPDEITSLGYGCFSYCNALTSVILSKNITMLPDDCFSNCILLSSIIIPNDITSLGNYCFDTCNSLTSVILSNNITILSDNCFSNCNLSSITLPQTLINMGDSCFLANPLTFIIIPDSVTSLGPNCFNSTNLTSIVIPDNILLLPDYCFSYSSLLTTVTLSQNLTTIQDYCFSNCSLLTTLIFKQQLSLASIGNNIFESDIPMNVTYYFTQDYNSLSDASKSLQDQFPQGTNYFYNASCFNKGTKILFLNIKTNKDEYILIENLQKEMLVKTYLHGYKKIEFIGKGFGKNSNKCSVYNMYKFKSNNFDEPLIITGGHSILVDNLGDYEKKNKEFFGENKKIDDKLLLLAVVTDDFVEMEDNYEFIYYHFVLENNDEYGQYGIWANGVLTETASKHHFLHTKL